MEVYATTSHREQAYEIAGRLIRRDNRRASVMRSASLVGTPLEARTLHSWVVLAAPINQPMWHGRFQAV